MATCMGTPVAGGAKNANESQANGNDQAVDGGVFLRRDRRGLITRHCWSYTRSHCSNASRAPVG
ncbi:hypothetical protein [Streptomyces sp. NPDC002132]|uniref:hypothetical protein n=1 Tax=unclassified Streptomyces TaxID=2593676 RepID=UPI00331DE2F6